MRWSIVVAILAIWMSLSFYNKLGAFGLFYNLSQLGAFVGEYRLVGLTPMFVKDDLNNVFTFQDVGRLDGKVALVTGANSGLGYYTAFHLAKQGADVIVHCRSGNKCDAAVKEMKTKLKGTKHGNLISMIANLADLKSVSEFSDLFLKKFDRLDIFVMNAGMAFESEPLTGDNLESKFQVNHLSHFLMYQKFEKLLTKTAEAGNNVHVVAVSSAAHYSPIAGVGVHTNEEDLNAGKDDGFRQYGASKLCNILFIKSLAEKTNGTSIYPNAAAPGMTKTSISNALLQRVEDATKDSTFLAPLGRGFISVFRSLENNALWSTEMGTLAQFYVSASPEIAQNNIRGKFYNPVNQETPVSTFVTKQLQDDLWNFSEKALKDRNFL